MRFLYFLLHVMLPYPLRIFYPRQRFINGPRGYFGRTIYVSNHAASFMDPLVIGSLQRPIVFFMTRSDIFKPALQPVLWLSHMLPIYRQHDGEDTKAKNDETFKKCTDVLLSGRNLLIFGEGFTDDVFIRRLKPVKKGAVRIGFGTLEAINWKKKIYITTLGVNYGDPNYLGSDLVISNGERICLNDYKEEYLLHPAKVTNELTKRIETDLQNRITHVSNPKWVFFHEHVTRLLRNGMHPEDSDFSIPLQKRWENSRELALWMNTQQLDENPELVALKADLETYFKKLKSKKVKEKNVAALAPENKNLVLKKRLFLATLWPLAILGVIHCLLPYLLIKRFVEKSFKRRVFWSSVKMMLGLVAIGLFNIPIVILMHKFIFMPLFSGFTPHLWLCSLAYYFLIPWPGIIAYNYRKHYQDLKQQAKLKKSGAEALLSERNTLISRIKALVFKTQDVALGQTETIAE